MLGGNLGSRLYGDVSVMFLLFWTPFWICASLQIAYNRLNYLNCSNFASLVFNASYKGSLTRIYMYYSKLYSLAHLHSYDRFALNLRGNLGLIK